MFSAVVLLIVGNAAEFLLLWQTMSTTPFHTVLEKVRWTYIVALYGSIYTIIHLGSNLFLLVKLEDSLSSLGSVESKALLRLVRLKSVISSVQILAALATGICFVSELGDKYFGRNLLGGFTGPWVFRVAIAVVSTLVATNCLQVYGEFFLRYTLDPCIGQGYV